MAKSHVGRNVGVGMGLAALAAGAYFLYGKDGAKNRKAVKGWMIKARADVVDKMENMPNVSKERYHEIVDSVMRGYRGMKDASPAELAAATAELKAHWSAIHKSMGAHAAKGGAKKPAKKSAAKKTSKKRV